MNYCFYRNEKEKSLLVDYAKKNNKNIEKLELIKTKITPKKFANLNQKDTIIIYDFAVFDNSTYKIIDILIRKIFPKSITVIVSSSKLTVNKFTCNGIANLLNSIYKAEKSEIQNRLLRTKKTIEKSGGKIGRVSGKKTKSMFDKHKKIIFKLNSQASTLKFILETIQKKDTKLTDATTQGLSAYIRKIKRIENIKEQLKIKDKLSGGALIEEDGWLSHK